MKKTVFLFLFIINLLSCNASKDLFYVAMPQEIKSITFENWTSGRMESGSGTVFIIEFEKPLRNNVRIEKIYYKNLETEFVQVNETKFKANFHYNTIFQEFQTSAIATKNFNLKDNEAIIEYQNHNKTYFYKCSNIKEIPMIMYE
jgi:hypothetical protein